MNPLAELKRLLAGRGGRQTGTVLSVADGQARVATPGGARTVPLGGVTAGKDDRVVIESGVVVGRLSTTPPPVYEV